MVGILIFILITIFLVIKLGEVLGLHVGYKINIKQEESVFSDASIEEVTPNDPDLASKIRNVSDICGKFDALDFVEKAKKAFEIIFEAYAKGDKSTLKNLLMPRLYNAFAMAIDDRHSRKETLDGILVRFVKSEIVDATISEKDIFVTMEFTTEQSNVLKSENGDIIEGNSDFIENHVDIWTFSREKASNNSRWYLYEIKNTDNN